jgi:hypothetical protein
MGRSFLVPWSIVGFFRFCTIPVIQEPMSTVELDNAKFRSEDKPVIESSPKKNGKYFFLIFILAILRGKNSRRTKPSYGIMPMHAVWIAGRALPGKEAPYCRDLSCVVFVVSV